MAEQRCGVVAVLGAPKSEHVLEGIRCVVAQLETGRAELENAYARVVSASVGGSVRVLRPYAHLHKLDVLRRGVGMPLGDTFSCIRPRMGVHCGECNKCEERRHGFAEAGMDDPTEYAK